VNKTDAATLLNTFKVRDIYESESCVNNVQDTFLP